MHHQYRPDIDGLRALAVLSVMAYHLNNEWLPGGFVGVDVFFVISGFVVTGSLAQGRPVSFLAFLRDFYARRLARILPALCVSLGVSVGLATLFIPTTWMSDLSERTARFAFLGASNIVLQNSADTYFAPRAEMNPYVHTWSLGVEEQFYVAIPFLVYLWVVSRANGRRGAAAVAVGWVAVAAAASLAACVVLSEAKPIVAFYFVGSRFWKLASGSLLFFLTQEPGRRIGAAEGWIGGASAWAGLLCCAIGFLFADGAAFPWPWATLPVMGTLLLVGGAHVVPTDAIRRILAAAPLVWVGKRSYSLYLWHWPIYVVMRWTVGLGG